MVSKVESFETSLVWKLAGSSSTRPSRLPRILVENHPARPSEVANLEDRRETRLDERLASLEVLAGDRHLGLIGQLPHSGDVDRGVGGSHDERTAFGQRGIGIAHRRSNMFTVVGFHGCLELG